MNPLNRLGAAPNVRHVHKGILQSIRNFAFDSRRPAVGICVEYRSEKGIQALLQHNRRFNNKLLPTTPEEPGGPLYGSLACSHLNLAFRCIKNNVSSPFGSLQALMEDPALKEVVLHGHKWWVLPESLGKDKQMDISLWRTRTKTKTRPSTSLSSCRPSRSPQKAS